MVYNSDDSWSGDRENLPLESAFTKCGVSRIDFQSFSDDLTYITECLQTLRELQQLVSTFSGFLFEDGLSHNLSSRHLSLWFDMYRSHSEMFCDEIEDRVTRLQRTIQKSGGIATQGM